MAMQPERQYMTFEQYLLLVTNSDRHYEYYDGEVRQLYRRLSISAVVEEVEEEGIPASEP